MATAFVVSTAEFDGWENRLFTKASVFASREKAAEFVNTWLDDIADDCLDEEEGDTRPGHIQESDITDGASFGFPDVENRYFTATVTIGEV